MPHLQMLNPLEKQVLENIAAIGSDEMRKRANILLELHSGENQRNIVKKLGIAKQTVTNWKKKWTSSTITSETWEDAIAKVNEVLGTNVGRPKKCKTTQESKIVEISEWSKNRKPSRSKHHHHVQVAEEAMRRGLPTLSPRSIERILATQTQ
ncbi:helix-turn-helix domain-containing protein [Brasilonema sp. UFV-L1]|uniref:helix-turn-helix domain-containing protein n=1 Tax=Brasilonema sp. UFV-L1 TaxID=2234130 RepID=UPI00145F3CE9|nr:helix-turn-helix domain-containing protein [Brasilonema sp. UFV-L1]NMG11371.1 helix-turn-helix domain-containing protein [Brasilonema sp. UFV-L1]